ncbi:MAG TPA: coproporphyrinogen III oxidase, partial [bacterium]|nr:coproporphyrinogen III oxidase [bacterium]
VEDDDYVEYYELVYNLLTASDYYHYEISSYALSGFECKHNKLYWRNYEYIGIGAAAHSYINKKRFWNYKFPRQYINAVLDKNNAEESFEILDDDRRLGETIMLNLHLAEGVNIKEINKKYQIDFLKKFRKQIEKLINQELIEVNNNNMKLTFKGRLFANIAASEFL